MTSIILWMMAHPGIALVISMLCLLSGIWIPVFLMINDNLKRQERNCDSMLKDCEDIQKLIQDLRKDLQ